jgi:hypothetical protein
MNEFLRERIRRKLESLSDERLYQVLDYVEFLESKYAERQNPGPNVFTRFAEGVEDRLRAGRISAQTIAQTMNLMNQAMSALSGVAAAGKSVAEDIVNVATRPTTAPPPTPTATTGTPSSAPAVTAPAPPPGAAPAAPAAPAATAATATNPTRSGESPT